MRRVSGAILAVMTGLAGAGLVLSTGACRPTRAAEVKGPPAGEVWLQPSEVAAAKIEVGTVGTHPVDTLLSTSSRVTFDPLRVGHVYSPVNGRVISITAKPGDHVMKGQTLAVISSPDIGSAAADELKARADLIASQHELDRQRQFSLHEASSPYAYEQAQDAYRTTLAEFQRAHTKNALLRAGGASTVGQTYTLTSPIEGEVVMRAVNPGIEVQGIYSGGTGVELFTIGQLDQVWVVADIYETDVARVKVGEPAQIKVVGESVRVYDANVDFFSDMLDPSTRTAQVRFKLPNDDHALKPEMYATASIQVPGREVLAIPRSAAMKLGDQNVVFVDMGKSAEGFERYVRMPVMIDEAVTGDWVPVDHGLDPGMKIVLSGQSVLAAKL